MDSTNQIRYASGLSALIGLYLVFSPFFIAISGPAFWSQLIMGVALVLFSGMQAAVQSTWPSWINGLVGLWLFVSAFAYSVSTNAFWNLIIAGAAVFLLAVWDGYEVSIVSAEHATT